MVDDLERFLDRTIEVLDYTYISKKCSKIKSESILMAILTFMYMHDFKD